MRCRSSAACRRRSANRSVGRSLLVCRLHEDERWLLFIVGDGVGVAKRTCGRAMARTLPKLGRDAPSMAAATYASTLVVVVDESETVVAYRCQ